MPVMAQNSSLMAEDNWLIAKDTVSAAGTDFYFTLFDHWGQAINADFPDPHQMGCMFTLHLTKDSEVDFSIPITGGSTHFSTHESVALTSGFLHIDSARLKGVHIHSTSPAYLHMRVGRTRSEAETMILPKHLLGKQYMLQGMPGTMIEDGANGLLPTYSQFTIVGTDNSTNVVVTPRVQLRCISRNNAVIPAGRPSGLFIQENEVLLFQPEDYNQDISGTLVESDKVVAVFQGNDATRLPHNTETDDYIWEQARPTDKWGREFIVAMSHLLTKNMVKFTALHDDTKIYKYQNNGEKRLMYTMQSGESYMVNWDRGISEGVIANHWVANNPVCCYLYTTGSTLNNNTGDPSMTEIVPVDNMATEAHCMRLNWATNAPHRYSILVTTRKEDEMNIIYNKRNLPSFLSEAGTNRIETGEFVTYEIDNAIGDLAFANHVIRTTGGGFTAYALNIGKTEAAATMNIGIPNFQPQELCLDGPLLFREVFDGNPVGSYQHTFDHLCSGSKLTFLANVTTRAELVYTNPMTGERLKTYKTDDAPYNGQWYKAGMNFTVPEDVDRVTLNINNASEDDRFAIDSVEVRLCAPPVTIEVPDTVYAGDKVTMTGEFFNDSTFVEPLEYQWFFSSDSTQWTAISDAIVKDWTTVAYDLTYSGWYRLAVYSAGGRGSNCCTMSEPKKMVVLPPILCSDGQLVYFQQSTGSWALYPKTLSGFCAGTKISFSVVTRYPVRLALYDATDDTELTHFEEDVDTPVRPHKVGLNYIIPNGISDITFVTSNGYNANADSFEVRLCVPKITIEAPDTVCIDTKNTFHAVFENDGSFQEPLQYQWYFSADSVEWTPVVEGNTRDLKIKAKMRHAGWYKVTVGGNGNADNEYCRSVSEPFKFFVIEDCPPILCPEGVLILHEDLTGSEIAYSRDLTGLCANLDLSLIVNLRPVHAAGRLLLRLTDIDTGRELRVYDTGDFPSDSMQVGTTFTVPEGVSNVRWTISNNIVGSIGSPLGIEDIEVRLCLEPIAVSGPNPACRKKPHVFRALYENYGILENPEFQWTYSADSVDWTVLQTGSSKTYTIPNVHKYHEGWYKVTVANVGNMEQVNCREESEPFKLHTQYCNTAVDQYVDTTACDTLLAYNLTWRGHEWQVVGTVTDTLIDIDEDDSVYVHKTLQTVICCPEIQYIRIDSITCDTLMPFLWFFRDTMLLYEDIGNNELEYQHYKWENCIGEVFTLALDTVHCERLYDLIVNKYNWQLLLDYTKLRRIFPERKYLAFQWYKNGEEIPGATDDDYSEQNELCGLFQLRIQLDEAVDNDDEFIWSKVLEIGEVEEPQPIIRRIYNWHGMLVGEGQMTRGVYLIVNIQGDTVWTEKKVVW